MTFEQWWNGEEAYRIAQGGDQWGLANAAWGAAEDERERAKPQWTRDLPTAPGWYWVKLPGCLPRVCMVWLVDSSLPLTCDEGDIGEFEGLWCGPLEVPQ